MADATYHELDPRISQGDIFEVGPHLYLEAPLAAVVEGNTRGVYSLENEPHTAFGKPDLKVATPCRRELAIILTSDCDIDKKARWIICPIVSLEELPEQNKGHAKRNRIYNFFFLPRYRDLLPDSLVVLDQVTTVNRDLLTGVNRVATLSDTGRFALYTQFVRLMTRWEFKDIKCPVCNSEFDPTTGMSVRNP